MRSPKTRCDGEWTEARFLQFIRSALRQCSMRWAPLVRIAPDSARRKNQSDNKRLRWEYQCAKCKDWYPRKQVEVDHIEPVGSLKCLDDLPGFVSRLLCEADGLVVLCDACHHEKTQKGKKKNA